MSLRERIILDGRQLDARIDGRITAAKLTRTMDGASSLALTLDDHDGTLLESGVFTRQGRPNRRERRLQDFDQAAWARVGHTQLVFDGWFTRLAGVHGTYGATGGVLELTFEDEVATLMRLQSAPMKSSRGGRTRAQFIGMLLNVARRQTGYGRYFSPEASVRQHIKRPDDPTRDRGIHPDAHLNVKGREATRDQKRLMERVLKVAERVNASKVAILALLEACIVESMFANLTYGDGTSVGILQLTDAHLGGSTSTRGGRRDVELVVELFLTKGFTGRGGAKELAAEHPDWTPGQVAQAVQGSAHPGRYEVYRAEAEAILDAWGGAGRVYTQRERHEYRAGGKNPDTGKAIDYWESAGDLAREVRWRLFADENRLYYVSDEWLFQQRPAFVIDRGARTSGLLSMEFSADIGLPLGEITLEARAARWTGPPGATVQIEQAGPLNGRWLIWSNELDVPVEAAAIVLRRPAPKLAEPAPSVRTRAHPRTHGDVTDAGLTFPLAQRGTNLGGVAAHQRRAWGNWQSDNAVDIGVPQGTAVYAVDSGEIIGLGGSWNGGSGNPDGWNVTLKTRKNTWFYTHLRRREPLKIGQRVAQGELLGESGAANGVNHLHIASQKGDPEKLLDVAPLPGSRRRRRSRDTPGGAPEYTKGDGRPD